mmetsp:Transcript_37985/g.62081  ORF Transcript_37985/g.62081 Transcript_37985/m.62081 type:complete len:82 (+) Transcript_37985:103-348(+)
MQFQRLQAAGQKKSNAELFGGKNRDATIESRVLPNPQPLFTAFTSMSSSIIKSLHKQNNGIIITAASRTRTTTDPPIHQPQ